MPKPRTYSQFEHDFALIHLEKAGGDFVKAAKLAGVEERALRYWAAGGNETQITDEVIQRGVLEEGWEAEGYERPYPAQPLALLHRTPMLWAPDHHFSEWVRDVYLLPSGPLYNPDHWYLRDAKIGYLWTNAESYRGKDKQTVAQAELVGGKVGNQWQTKQYWFQLMGWFGDLPDFVLRFDAPVLAEYSDRDFCAVVDHELYHCAIKLDDFELPRYDRENNFIWSQRPHTSEEFDRVVGRYGSHLAAGGSAEIIAASKQRPEVTDEQIAEACGTGKLNPWND